MSFLANIGFDHLALSFLACVMIREVMVMALPDHIVGPGGWLIDTGPEEV